MINKKYFFHGGKAGFALGALLVATMTGCVVDGPRAGVYVAPPVVEVGVQDDYVYYPGYNVYYNSGRHEFAYMNGGVWVSRPSFPGVSVNVLLASPSVRMDFHDSPANHHEEIARRYPSNWTPHGAAPAHRPEAQKAPARKPNAKPEKHDEHAEK